MNNPTYPQDFIDKLILGDCLEVMKFIPDKSIDMILCDLPYGTTACKWDTVIPFDPLWGQYRRIVKDHSAIVLTASEPFASYLRMSNIKWYKYDWVWNKKLAGNGILAKIQPLKIHELCLVFGYRGINYFPIMTKGKLRAKLTGNLKISKINNGDGIKCCKETFNDLYYPKSVIDFSLANCRKGRLHPTQKPVALFEYLIRTYTNENDLVLDNCIGSGTTAIACLRTNRRFIGMEKDPDYFRIARKRIADFKIKNKEERNKDLNVCHF